MSLALAHKQEVEFENPFQTTTAKTFCDVRKFKDPSSGDANLVIRASGSLDVRFTTVGTVPISQEALQEELSFTIPSGLELPDFPIESGKLKQTLPIYLGSAFYMEGDLFRFENEDLSLFVSGYTLEELFQELYEHIDFLWTEYALENDEKLDPSGRALKYRLLEQFEQIE